MPVINYGEVPGADLVLPGWAPPQTPGTTHFAAPPTPASWVKSRCFRNLANFLVP
jgi:hypothetical protein